jgi:hypothetical protein
MVVYLAVVRHDNLAVFVRERLRASRYVDDAEADMRQANSSPDIESISIGTAVADGGGHATE